MSELERGSYIGGSTWVEVFAAGGRRRGRRGRRGRRPLVVPARAAVHVQLYVVAQQVRLDLLKPHVAQLQYTLHSRVDTIKTFLI